MRVAVIFVRRVFGPPEILGVASGDDMPTHDPDQLRAHIQDWYKANGLGSMGVVEDAIGHTVFELDGPLIPQVLLPDKYQREAIVVTADELRAADKADPKDGGDAAEAEVLAEAKEI